MEIQPWTWNWTAIMAGVASVVALYSAKRANKIAHKSLSATIDMEIFRIKERQIVELRNSFADFASSVAAIRKNETGDLFREDVALTRKYSAKIKLLLDESDEDFELLSYILADEMGVATKSEKEKIGKAHLYTIGRRILDRKYKEIEKELRQYNA